MQLIGRGGPYLRVADPDWSDPLDGSYSMTHGGRWNAPGSFPVLYLNADLPTARANARRFLVDRLAGTPFLPSDFDPEALPVLVTVALPPLEHLDVVTDQGIVANGLPVSYPLEPSGAIVSHATCQPIGQQAFDDDLPGIACRSAAAGAPIDGEELAWLDSDERPLTEADRAAFSEWYGPVDW